MARTQSRTVTVLRAAVPRLLPIARRLLAVAGLVLAGWLLGTSGQASADTTTGPAVTGTATHTADQAVAGLSQSLGLERQVPASEITGLPRQAVHAVVRAVKDGAVRQVRPPVRPMVHSQRPRGRGVASEAAHKPVTAGAPKSHVIKVKGKHTVKNKRHVERAPMPVRQPYSPEAGSMLPQAGGGVVMGGWMAAPFRAGSFVIRRPVLVLAPWIGALPPVVRTAADEPSLSPD